MAGDGEVLGLRLGLGYRFSCRAKKTRAIREFLDIPAAAGVKVRVRSRVRGKIYG